MIYRSNLEAPDLTPNFRHLHMRPMGHSFGHSVPSDWADKAEDDPRFALYKKCGLWTHDEAALLYNIVKAAPRSDGLWADIGAHTGWTSAHIEAALGELRHVECVDPALADAEFNKRFVLNNQALIDGFRVVLEDVTSARYWRMYQPIVGACIDGDHQPGEPLKDAMGAHACGAEIIVFHDFIGAPVRDAVTWLRERHKYRVMIYLTPHVVAVCWRDGLSFTPPVHEYDPELLKHKLEMRMPDFNFTAGGWWGNAAQK